MDELLRKTKVGIQEGLSYIRAKDVFITPHEAFRPSTVKMPCIGIKDGRVGHVYLAGGGKESTMLVTFCLFVSLSKQETSLIGDESANRKGILQINTDLINLLENNLLGISGMQAAEVHNDPESTLYIPKQGVEVQHKLLTLIYTKETG